MVAAHAVMMLQAHFLTTFHLLTLSFSRVRMFELQPRAKKVFGFEENYKPVAGELGRMGVLIHAIRIIQKFDTALSMVSSLLMSCTTLSSHMISICRPIRRTAPCTSSRAHN
jgi:hypothetical protein